jgi:hypothetical protein
MQLSSGMIASAKKQFNYKHMLIKNNGIGLDCQGIFSGKAIKRSADSTSKTPSDMKKRDILKYEASHVYMDL